MSEWAPKRFWKAADVARVDTGFAVQLDGRGVKTPAKTPLVVPTEALAREIAGEWDAQVEKIDPNVMPATRMANSALDKVTIQFAEVADMLAAYGDSDLLCYRAGHPVELVARQNEKWNPMLDWAEATFGAKLEPRTGVIHAPQDETAIAKLTAEVHALSAFQLAAFHDLVSLSGSLVLGLAVAKAEADVEEIWALSRLDERWQEEQWGEDEEATALAERKRSEFKFAEKFYRLATET